VIYSTVTSNENYQVIQENPALQIARSGFRTIHKNGPELFSNFMLPGSA